MIQRTKDKFSENNPTITGDEWLEEVNDTLEPLDGLFSKNVSKHKDICNKTYWKHNFANSDFSGMTFRNVSFVECDLQEVNFSECTFINTNFYKSAIRGAIIMSCAFDDFSIAGLKNSVDYGEAYIEGEDIEKRLESAKAKRLPKLFNREIWEGQIKTKSNILYLLDNEIYIESLYKLSEDLNVVISPITSLYLLLRSNYLIAIITPGVLSKEQWKNYFRYLHTGRYYINTIILTKPLAKIKIPEICRDSFIVYDDWKSVLAYIRIRTKLFEKEHSMAQKRHLLMERLFRLKMMFINDGELSVKKAACELGVSRRTIERDISKLFQIMDFQFSYDKKQKKYKHSYDIPKANKVEIYDLPELYGKYPQVRKSSKNKEKKIQRYTWIIGYLLKNKKLLAKRYLEQNESGVSLRTLQRDLKELMLLYPCIRYDLLNKCYCIDSKLIPYEWKTELVSKKEGI